MIIIEAYEQSGEFIDSFAIDEQYTATLFSTLNDLANKSEG